MNKDSYLPYKDSSRATSETIRGNVFVGLQERINIAESEGLVFVASQQRPMVHLGSNRKGNVIEERFNTSFSISPVSMSFQPDVLNSIAQTIAEDLPFSQSEETSLKGIIFSRRGVLLPWITARETLSEISRSVTLTSTTNYEILNDPYGIAEKTYSLEPGSSSKPSEVVFKRIHETDIHVLPSPAFIKLWSAIDKGNTHHLIRVAEMSIFIPDRDIKKIEKMEKIEGPAIHNDEQILRRALGL